MRGFFMKDDIEINPEPASRRDMSEKKSKRNIYGIYIGICLVIVGVLWYAVNMGLIPLQYLQSWPQILIVLVGLLILIKSL